MPDVGRGSQDPPGIAPAAHDLLSNPRPVLTHTDSSSAGCRCSTKLLDQAPSPNPPRPGTALQLAASGCVKRDSAQCPSLPQMPSGTGRVSYVCRTTTRSCSHPLRPPLIGPVTSSCPCRGFVTAFAGNCPFSNGKDTMMKLIWVGCIFGAGYVLGRPEGRAKLAELLQHPEVTQLKQQATSTASTAVKTSRHQLSTATQKFKDNAAQRRPGTSTDASAAVTDSASRRRLRLPQFARQGVRSGGSAVPVAGPVPVATETAAPDTSPSATPISQASSSPPVEDA